MQDGEGGVKGALLQHWQCDACLVAGHIESADEPPAGWLFQRLPDGDAHACTEDCARALIGLPLLGWRVSANQSPCIVPHVSVPDWALRVPELNRASIPTYVLLCQLAPSSPSMADLAAQLRLDRRSVIRHVRHLERVGLLRVKRRQIDGCHVANAYEIMERQHVMQNAKAPDA